MSDPKSTEDAAKESLPGNDPEVNDTAGTSLLPLQSTKAIQLQRMTVAAQAKPTEEANVQTDPDKMSDADVIALAQAERDAGIPDRQTAAAAADATTRIPDDGHYGIGHRDS